MPTHSLLLPSSSIPRLPFLCLRVPTTLFAPSWYLLTLVDVSNHLRWIVNQQTDQSQYQRLSSFCCWRFWCWFWPLLSNGDRVRWLGVYLFFSSERRCIIVIKRLHASSARLEMNMLLLTLVSSMWMSFDHISLCSFSSLVVVNMMASYYRPFFKLSRRSPLSKECRRRRCCCALRDCTLRMWKPRRRTKNNRSRQCVLCILSMYTVSTRKVTHSIWTKSPYSPVISTLTTTWTTVITRNILCLTWTCPLAR